MKTAQSNEPAGAARPTPAVEGTGAKPKLSGPKRQHFLPQFYLDGFTKDGMLAVYDRESDEVRIQQPVNTGVIGHFYTLEDAEGRKRFELEHFLSEIEGKASGVIRKLIVQQDINADERADLAIFVALAAFRTPDVVDSIKAFNSDLIGDLAKRMFDDPEVVKDRMRDRPGSPASEEELERQARELVDFAKGGQYRIETDHKWAVGMSIQMALAIAPILAGRDWSIIHRDAPKKSYVTTDAPVLLTTIRPRENTIWGVGFGNSDALVLFPLAESCIMAIYGASGALEHRVEKDEVIRRTNLALAARCQRFVIGRDAALVRSLADRIGLAGKTWEPKIQRR